MPIQFQCPNCKRGLTVKDEMAGKRGPCPGCKTVLTVPAASTAPARPAAAPASPPVAPSSPPAARKPARPAARSAPAAAKTAPSPLPPPPPPAPAAEEPPPKPPEDVEAEAAALLADEPAQQAAPEVKNIDFQCPFCDEQVQLPLELAGKKSPCPNCRRVVKVPEPTNKGPKDWRQADARLPLGARRPDQPTPEGAWGTETVGRVGAEALLQAGVIKPPAPPRTLWQKVRLPAAGVALLVVAVVATFSILAWRARGRQQQALDLALAYAGSDEAKKTVHEAGRAALYIHAGEYFLRQQKPGCATQASERFNQSLQALRAASGSERDLVLPELALHQLELAGTDEEARQEIRARWPDVLRSLRASLEAIESPDGRLEALRLVCPRLLSLGHGDRILPLVNQLFAAEDANRAEALSVVGLVFLAGGEKKLAEQALNQVLPLYQAEKKSKTKPVSLRAAVVTLALALKKEAPAGRKEPGQDEERHIGEAGGLARQSQWDKARQQADDNSFGPKVKLRALLAVAAAAADEKAGSADVEKAVQMAVPEAAGIYKNEADQAERDKVSWELLRLTRVGLRAGVGPDTLAHVAGVIGDRGLRGWAQLELLLPRLEPKGSGVEESAVEQVEKGALAHALGRLYLARYKTRQDAGWAKTVQGWEDPDRAFGSLGVALGLQDRDKGT